MTNPYASEVALVIDGKRRVLKLTLGALAELEDALRVGSLVDLVERFETGAFSSRDVLVLILAGLRGGGAEVVQEDLLQADISDGPVAATTGLSYSSYLRALSSASPPLHYFSCLKAVKNLLVLARRGQKALSF